MTTTHNIGLTLAAITFPLFLSACGAESPEPTVASLPDTVQVAATTDENPTDDRPVLGVDDTETERRQVWNAYNACLLDHGATSPTSGMAVKLGDSLVDYEHAPRRALAACGQLEPVQPPALAAATNPDFRAETQEYVACLADGGLFVTLLGDDTMDWTYTAGHPVPEDSAQLERACLVEAYGA
jgi:hypothetical protein